MPASCKSVVSMKGSKITRTLKWKASKVIKAILPKKKRRGLTNDDGVSLALTSSETPAQTPDKETSNESAILDSNESTTISVDGDTGDEDVDTELGTSLFLLLQKELLIN